LSRSALGFYQMLVWIPLLKDQAQFLAGTRIGSPPILCFGLVHLISMAMALCSKVSFEKRRYASPENSNILDKKI
jgi:hypothetical protein